MAKVKMTSTILQQECIGTDIYSLWLDAPKIASQAKPGQFISVYSNDSGRVLPRPISICEIDREKGALRIVYRIAGNGTKEFSGMKAGETLDIRSIGKWFPYGCDQGKTRIHDGRRNRCASNGADCKRSRGRSYGYCRIPE